MIYQIQAMEIVFEFLQGIFGLLKFQITKYPNWGQWSAKMAFLAIINILETKRYTTLKHAVPP